MAAFTQRKLLVVLAAIPEDDFALPECRGLVEYEVDRQKAQRIYDRTKAALVELAEAIESASGPQAR
jgi:predicted nucleic acid-binding Zn ribbon protein